MSALARYYKAQGYEVAGSDIQNSKLLKELRAEGIKIKIGHNKWNIKKGTALVIYNQAITENNPELKEARRLGIRVISYPAAIGELTREFKTVAIAGSHGKSTTTALVAQILIKAGLDPTVIVGTRVKEFGNTNFRLGSQSSDIASRKNSNDLRCRYMVLEADEYGRAFHHYSPFAAVITNIDKEHLDTYKNLAGVKKSFLQFIEGFAQPRGCANILVLNERDKNLKSLEKEIAVICKKKKIEIFWYGKNPHIKGLSSLGLLPSLLGDHNISNASGAHALARALRVNDKVIFDTLKNFSGTWRRLEFRGACQLSNVNCQMSVYDDYAHHPTEIRASLAALRQRSVGNGYDATSLPDNLTPKPNRLLNPNPNPPLICVFQPHQTERLAALFDEFVDAFKDADALILLDVYRVPGRDKSTTSNKQQVTSKTLAEKISKKYPEKKVIYLKNPKNIYSALTSLLTTNYQLQTTHCTVVLMGAGDIVKYTDLLLKNKKVPLEPRDL